MQKKEFWKESIVYQIYPRSFFDSNQDGIGDIKGIITKLDYLKTLGVDIIWLSPVYQSPNDDNGYDISDYYQIQPEFGTMDDMDLLIQTAKEKGLKIIMDLVINHTSDEHQWFINSQDPQSPYRDYYIWQPKPNNWTSFFGGPAWSELNKAYYLHLFSKKQPDLNWQHPKIIEEIKDVMHFWLKKGISGFRCDVINIIYKSSLKNGKNRFVLTGKEHYHSQPGMHDILKTLHKDVLSQYEAVTVGETVMVSTKQANDLILPEHQELDMVFGFEHMEVDQINNKWFKTKFNPTKWMKVVAKWQQEVYWNANYLENHDQPRSVSRFGNDQKFHGQSAKMLATILMTLKGTPFIFEGQEIGMTNYDFKSMDDFRDNETFKIDLIAKKLLFPKRLRFKMLKKTSRDNARTPMQWTKAGGFTEGVPWIAMNENTQTINVSDALNDPKSIYHYYKALIALRKTIQPLIYGDFKPIYMKRDLFAYQRSYNNELVIVVSNMSDKPKYVPLHLKGTVLLSNYNRRSLDNNYLEPYESIILMKE